MIKDPFTVGDMHPKIGRAQRHVVQHQKGPGEQNGQEQMQWAPGPTFVKDRLENRLGGIGCSGGLSKAHHALTQVLAQGAETIVLEGELFVGSSQRIEQPLRFALLSIWKPQLKRFGQRLACIVGLLERCLQHAVVEVHPRIVRPE